MISVKSLFASVAVATFDVSSLSLNAPQHGHGLLSVLPVAQGLQLSLRLGKGGKERSYHKKALRRDQQGEDFLTSLTRSERKSRSNKNSPVRSRPSQRRSKTKSPMRSRRRRAEGWKEMEAGVPLKYLQPEEVKQLNRRNGGSGAPMNGRQGTLNTAVQNALSYEEGLGNKAYKLAKELVQGHIFHDGNKRTATKAVELFLKKNQTFIVGGKQNWKTFFGIVNATISPTGGDDQISRERFAEILKQITYHNVC